MTKVRHYGAGTTNDEADWEAWVDFFSRTREPNGRRKGRVEIRL